MNFDSMTRSYHMSDYSSSTNLKWVKILKNITENYGRTIVLECQVQSSYPVTFNWYRYNNPLDRSRFIIIEDSFRSR